MKRAKTKHFKRLAKQVEKVLLDNHEVVYPVVVLPNPERYGMVLRAGVGSALIERTPRTVWTVSELHAPGQPLNLKYETIREVVCIKNLISVVVPLPVYVHEINTDKTLSLVLAAIEEAEAESD